MNALTHLRELSAQTDMRGFDGPMDELRAVLNLSGHKFCLLAAEREGYRLVATHVGGVMRNEFEETVGALYSPETHQIVFDAMEAQERLSWTPYLDAGGDGIGTALAQAGLKSGFTAPILNICPRYVASICAVGAEDESAAAFDARMAEIWPDIKLAALTMVETAFEVVRASVRDAVTPSEAAVLSELVGGKRIREVAAVLGKSESTVRHQMASARDRLGAATTSEAVAIWVESGGAAST